MHRVVLAGSVGSSVTTLEMMLKHHLNVVGVFGLEPKNVSKVSGLANMQSLCENNNVPYFPFTKINSEENIRILKDLQPDLFFVIGLSQLVSEEMLTIPRLGCIGFHPTLLPAGRGRAPLAWLILNETKGAANFFLMGKGADDGPIFVQKEFIVGEGDTAMDVGKKIEDAIILALDEWFPKLQKGEWNPVPQDESSASWYGKRAPEDGVINWHSTAASIDKLIRASGPPHPGAFTFANNKQLIILRCKLENQLRIKGVPGNVLLVKDTEYLVQAGDDPIWISGILNEQGESVSLMVGQHLGYYNEIEIHKLKNEIAIIKEKLGI